MDYGNNPQIISFKETISEDYWNPQIMATIHRLLKSMDYSYSPHLPLNLQQDNIKEK